MLKNPPRSIGDFIDRRLRQVRAQINANVIMKMLQYSGVVKRPLNINEIGELMSLSVAQSTWDRGRVPSSMHRVVAPSHGLVYVDEEDGTVHYVHSSARQHLFIAKGEAASEFKYDETDLALGQLCLTCLNSNDFNRQLTRWQDKCGTNITPLEIGLTSTQNSTRIISKAAQALLRSRGSLRRLSTRDLKQRAEKILGVELSSQLEAARQASRFYFLHYAQRFWIYRLTNLDLDTDPGEWHTFIGFAEDHNEFVSRPWWPRGEIRADFSSSWALEHNHAALLAVLLKSQFQQFHPYQINDALRVAVSCKHRHLVNILLGHKRRYPWINQDALELALQFGDLGCLRLFVAEGGDPARALREAAFNNDTDTIELLLAVGANVNAGNGSGEMAAGADIDACSGYLVYRRTALQAAAEGGHLRVVEHLSSSNANVDATNNFGQTVLLLAAKKGSLSIVVRLVVAGADVRVVDDLDRTALQAAAAGRYSDVVEFLEAMPGSLADAHEPILPTSSLDGIEGHISSLGRD